jgi:hypothetical protein
MADADSSPCRLFDTDTVCSPLCRDKIAELSHMEGTIHNLATNHANEARPKRLSLSMIRGMQRFSIWSA